jgi:hypothetical protein
MRTGRSGREKNGRKIRPRYPAGEREEVGGTEGTPEA